MEALGWRLRDEQRNRVRRREPLPLRVGAGLLFGSMVSAVSLVMALPVAVVLTLDGRPGLGLLTIALALLGSFVVPPLLMRLLDSTWRARGNRAFWIGYAVSVVAAAAMTAFFLSVLARYAG